MSFHTPTPVLFSKPSPPQNPAPQLANSPTSKTLWKQRAPTPELPSSATRKAHRHVGEEVNIGTSSWWTSVDLWKLNGISKVWAAALLAKIPPPTPQGQLPASTGIVIVIMRGRHYHSWHSIFRSSRFLSCSSLPSLLTGNDSLSNGARQPPISVMQLHLTRSFCPACRRTRPPFRGGWNQNQPLPTGGPHAHVQALLCTRFVMLRPAFSDPPPPPRYRTFIYNDTLVTR